MRWKLLVLILTFVVGGCFVERRGLRDESDVDGAVGLDSQPPGPDAAACPRIDITRDPNNCGECGNRCLSVPNATSTCTDSRCGIDCDSTHGDCDGDVGTGCEVLLDRNPAHCGGCRNDCSAMPGGANTTSGGCAAGVCLVECLPGFGDCDAADGCETDLTSSRANCGTCGTVCALAPNGQPFCEGGACRVLCDGPQFLDCNGIASDGCEENVDDDFKCGLCDDDPSGMFCTPAISECVCDPTSCRCDGPFTF